MRNRIRRFDGNSDDSERILKELSKGFKDVFSNSDIGEINQSPLKDWQVEGKKILLYEQFNKNIDDKLTTSEDVSNLINALNSIANVVKDVEAPKEYKAFLLFSYRYRLFSLSNANKMVKELFNRKGEIKESLIRSTFLYEYIYWEAYCHYSHNAGDNTEEYRFKASRFINGLTGDLFVENTLPIKECDKHFAELCCKYEENGLINWNDTCKNDIFDNLPTTLKEKVNLMPNVFKKLLNEQPIE